MKRTHTIFSVALAALVIAAGLASVRQCHAQAPSFLLGPGTMDFFATQAGPDPVQQGLAVAGTPGMQWEASSPATWVSLTAATGTTPSLINVRVSNSLPAGAYATNVNFISTNNPGVTGSMTVNFTVNAAAVLSVNKTTYNFKAVQGHAAPDQFLTVQSGAAAGWTGTVTGAPWLSITPTSGTVYNDPANPVRIQVSAAGLGINDYSGKLTISSPGAVPSSVEITVNLKVTPPPIMETAPRPLNVSVEQGKAAKPTLEIRNSGASETELNWSIAQPAENWIKLSLTGNCDGPFPSMISGFTAGARRTVVTVCIMTAPALSPQLTLGTYSTTLTVLAPDANLLTPGADVVPVNLTVVADLTPPTVMPNSIFFGEFDTSTTPVNRISIPPSADCNTAPPSTSVKISWTTDEYGDTRLKWGEQLVNGVPQYERGTVLMPEGLDTGAHTGGTLYHTVTLTSMNYVYSGHTYYFAIASQDRYGNPVDWSVPGVWTDHNQTNPALYLSFTITHSCDVSAPTNVSLQVPNSSSTLFGTITVVMSAQDEALVTRFDLVRLNPDTVLASYAVAPTQCTSNGDSFSCLVTASYDTKLMPDGASNLVARAYDVIGHVGVSPIVTISVSNKVPEVSTVVATPTDQGDGSWKTVITWDTDTASDSSIQYGIEDDDGSFNGYTYVKSGDDTGRTDITNGHSVTLSGLLAGRVYHYMITSCPQGISDPERCGH